MPLATTMPRAERKWVAFARGEVSGHTGQRRGMEWKGGPFYGIPVAHLQQIIA